jgi:hypothetical protein
VSSSVEVRGEGAAGAGGQCGGCGQALSPADELRGPVPRDAPIASVLTLRMPAEASMTMPDVPWLGLGELGQLETDVAATECKVDQVQKSGVPETERKAKMVAEHQAVSASGLEKTRELLEKCRDSVRSATEAQRRLAGADMNHGIRELCWKLLRACRGLRDLFFRPKKRVP